MDHRHLLQSNKHKRDKHTKGRRLARARVIGTVRFGRPCPCEINWMQLLFALAVVSRTRDRCHEEQAMQSAMRSAGTNGPRAVL